MKKVFIDTDGEFVDFMALVLALKSPDLVVEGISTISGIRNLRDSTDDVLNAVELLGRGEKDLSFRESPAPGGIEGRKADHIRINLDEDVGFNRLTVGFENYRFIHQALPELDLHAVDLTTRLFNKSLKAPVLISSMTGGTEQAQQINLNLAAAAQLYGVAMGLGSQRAGIVRPETRETFKVRYVAPDILLFANIGAVQFNYGFDVEHFYEAVEMIEADALILHLNPLQEAVQPEGDVNFAGLAKEDRRSGQETMDEMAQAYGHTMSADFALGKYIDEKLHRATTASVSMLAGIPSLTAELGSPYTPHREVVYASISGLRNVMRWAGMLDSEMEANTGIKVVDPGFATRRRSVARATQACMVHHLKEPGDLVMVGDPLVEMRDAWGRMLGVLTSEYEGFVISHPAGILFYPGESTVLLAIHDDEPLVGE